MNGPVVATTQWRMLAFSARIVRSGAADFLDNRALPLKLCKEAAPGSPAPAPFSSVRSQLFAVKQCLSCAIIAKEVGVFELRPTCGDQIKSERRSGLNDSMEKIKLRAGPESCCTRLKHF